jgi:DNA-binding NtrC family response regulator
MSKDQINSTRPRVLIVDDIPANLKVLRDALEPEGYRISGAPNGETALRIAAGTLPDIILLDVVMSDIDGYEVCRRLKENEVTRHIPVIFVTVKDEKANLIEGFHVGGVDYITKPFEKEEVLVRVETHLKIGRLTQELMQKNRELEEEIAKRQQAEESLQRADEHLALISQKEAKHWGIEGFVGKSQTISKILSDIRKLQSAKTTSVLISGESGTGKELIARAIHFGGTRAKGPFIDVNCSAIPHELAESAFFGHTRGAFTGANTSHKGYFELASGGTLFLDEIGDMPLELQAKLLRTLETNSVTPVGSTHPKDVDVRILAATNQNLRAKIAEGSFRKELYFRLARYTVTVPPLRERREDIPLLTEHFLKLFASEMGIEQPVLSAEALSALETYYFPGNVRELKNIIECALIKTGGSVIQPEHLHFIADSDVFIGPYITPESCIQSTEGADFEYRKELVIKRASKLREAKSLQSGQDTDGDEITNEEKILAYIEERGSINNSECRSLLSVDIRHASYLLNKLREYGLIEPDGERRWARYRLA